MFFVFFFFYLVQSFILNHYVPPIKQQELATLLVIDLFILCLIYMHIINYFVISEQLHKNLKILSIDVPAIEPVRAVPAFGEFLFFVPSSVTTDTCYQQSHTSYHCTSSDWCTWSHCHQRCIR